MYYMNIRKYQEALEHYESIVPIQSGKNKGVRPLLGIVSAGRRKTYIAIRKEEDEIIISLHGVDIVRYKPNNDIIINVHGKDNIATCSLLSTIFGYNVCRINNKLWLVVWWDNLSFYLSSKGNNVLRFDKRHKGGGVSVTPADVPKRYKLNRKEAKKLMENYSEFKEYVTSMLRLHPLVTEDGVSKRHIDSSMVIKSNVHLSNTQAEELARNGGDASTYGQVYMHLLQVNLPYWYKEDGYTTTVSDLLRPFRKYVYRVHRDRVGVLEVMTSHHQRSTF